jgi:PIN domain nuclease of toxin-antitoxin system
VGLLRFLLDTHCWVWLKTQPERLPSPLRRKLLRDPSLLVLSSVSVIELAIKATTGRLSLTAPLGEFVGALMDEGIASLDITPAHALRMSALPPLHRDPFDRLLIAQAAVEQLSLVSADANVLAYDVRTIDARK